MYIGYWTLNKYYYYYLCIRSAKDLGLSTPLSLNEFNTFIGSLLDKLEKRINISILLG